MSINERFSPREIRLHADVANIDTDAAYYIPYCGAPGFITYAAICNDTQTTTDTCTVRLALGSTNVTGGLITIASGTAAGSVTTCLPTANNKVENGAAIKLTFAGSSGGSSRGHVLIVVTLEP